MRILVPLLAGALLVAPGPATAASAPRAFLQSLLVPGWGQRYAGDHRSAAWFLGAEVALWSGYWGLQRLAEVREDRFQTYAAVHAGARTAGRSDGFYDDLGFYDSVLQHNQYAAYQDGPAAELYEMTPEDFWEWDDPGSRTHYRDLRNRSERTRRQALYLAGVTVVNHVFSAVHAARTCGKGGGAAAARDPGPPALQTAYQPLTGRACITWVHRF